MGFGERGDNLFLPFVRLACRVGRGKTQRELLCLQSYQSQASPLETQRHLKAEERIEVASYFLSNAFWEIGWIYSCRSVIDMIACVQQTARAKYACTDVQKDALASPLQADSSQRERINYE